MVSDLCCLLVMLYYDIKKIFVKPVLVYRLRYSVTFYNREVKNNDMRVFGSFSVYYVLTNKIVKLIEGILILNFEVHLLKYVGVSILVEDALIFVKILVGYKVIEL